MVFNSLTFIVFFATVLMLHRLPLPWSIKKAQLLLASYLFYAAWNPPFVMLLWISTLTDWFAAKAMYRARKTALKRFFLVLSLVVNLGLLGYFKYGGFILQNFIWLMGELNIAFEPLKPDVVLPVGISFYTFQSLSYTLDVYRGKLEPWPSFLDFAMFVTFFPQLVAGPIVRAADFLPQCREPRSATDRQTAWGLCLLASGLFQKIILADGLLAPVGDRVYASAAQAGTLDAWIGTLAFSGQIFFDFNGYSSCAIGAALCLGFILPDNFRYPYGAVGFRDFWRRWHISLSTWLKDYLYISLGGNRKGHRRTLINLMLTMLIGGLWHGASWRFVIWGGLHGIYLVAERLVSERIGGREVFRKTGSRLGLALLTYALICITWVFFRAPDFGAAFEIFTDMFSGASATLLSLRDVLVVALINVALFLGHFALGRSSMETVVQKMPWQLRAAVVSAILLTLALAPGDDRAFIYFQF
jgi:alginate O-acetyltransferase complex protein AlgI